MFSLWAVCLCVGTEHALVSHIYVFVYVYNRRHSSLALCVMVVWKLRLPSLSSWCCCFPPHSFRLMCEFDFQCSVFKILIISMIARISHVFQSIVGVYSLNWMHNILHIGFVCVCVRCFQIMRSSYSYKFDYSTHLLMAFWFQPQPSSPAFRANLIQIYAKLAILTVFDVKQLQISIQIKQCFTFTV